jgi:hypothetical protein
LAEFFFIKRITVFFNPTFVIHHNEHTSTSLLKNSIRRSLFNDSYKSILSKYYK